MTLVKYEYLALETGMLATAGVAKLKLKPAHLKPAEGEGERATTGNNRPSPIDGALRKAAQNAVVLSTIILGEKWHERLTRACLACSEPLHAWHRLQNHKLRSVPDIVE